MTVVFLCQSCCLSQDMLAVMQEVRSLHERCNTLQDNAAIFNSIPHLSFFYSTFANGMKIHADSSYIVDVSKHTN